MLSVLLNQYCLSDKIKKNEIDGACGTYGGKELRIQGLVRKPEGRRPLGRRSCRWEDNIKM